MGARSIPLLYYPGPESMSAAGALDRWLAKRRESSQAAAAAATAATQGGLMGVEFHPGHGIPMPPRTRALESALGMNDLLGFAEAGGMPWDDACDGRGDVGGRQDSWVEGPAFMRESMRPPLPRKGQSISDTRGGSLLCSSSSSLDLFRHAGLAKLKGGRRRIAQETQMLKALKRVSRPTPSVADAALPSSPPAPKRHRGRIETPADHIARDVSARHGECERARAYLHLSNSGLWCPTSWCRCGAALGGPHASGCDQPWMPSLTGPCF